MIRAKVMLFHQICSDILLSIYIVTCAHIW